MIENNFDINHLYNYFHYDVRKEPFLRIFRFEIWAHQGYIEFRWLAFSLTDFSLCEFMSWILLYYNTYNNYSALHV